MRPSEKFSDGLFAVYLPKVSALKLLSDSYQNDTDLLGQMVSERLGIALLPDWEVEKVPLYLVYYKNRGPEPTVRSMVDFLLEKFAPLSRTPTTITKGAQP